MLGPRLRILRELSGLTQKQVAEVLNIDRSTYSYYEISKTRPDIDTLQKLADLFKVSTDYLLDYKSSSEPSLQDETSSYNSRELKNLRYLSELSKQEQQVILYYRALEEEKKDTLLKKAKEMCEDYSDKFPE